MPRNGNEPPPVEVHIAKPRLLNPFDSAIGKAMAEAAQEELEALFQTGPRRRTFRLVRGRPAEGGLVIDAAIHDLALGPPRENAALLSFVVVLQADGARRRALATGRVEGHAGIDTARNPARQAVQIMRDALRRGAGRFVDACEAAARDR